ncbi:MAG: UDP-N-acetylmuramoyl-L-alanyl-D-glutamate--2,6-diaminopimelate ligase [Gemmatimonadales bacterium]
MTLQQLVSMLRRHDLVVEAPDTDVSLDAIAVDSRLVKPGTLFIAVRGSVVDGHTYIAKALASGAVAVVAEQGVALNVPLVIVRDGQRAARLLAEAWYGSPSEAMQLVGVTGTNGKTTTTALMRHLLNDRHDSGSIGTLGAFDADGRSVPSTAGSLTTPGPLDLQATLRALVDAGVRRVTMETSSHALDQGRLDGLAFAAGIFTNLTRDHLDYHVTMEQYLAAKRRLADLVTSDGVLSVNADDPAWQGLHSDKRTITWGLAPDAALRVEDVMSVAAGSRFTLSGRFGNAEVSIPFPGDFNVANAAGAAAAALGLGIPLATVVDRLGSAPQVPGRMEKIVDAPFHVLRDYAHTPDALERALATLRPLTPRRLIVVFGCGGDRDKGKRPIMGKIAAAGSDHAIVTSDNPRTEDPDLIIDDIVAGMPKSGWERESDRYVAIAQAVGQAGPGDAVLLAGKGHETYQVVGTEYLPFDERDIVLGLLGR